MALETLGVFPLKGPSKKEALMAFLDRAVVKGSCTGWQERSWRPEGMSIGNENDQVS
ncbi:hypothetical protein ACFFHG_20115 [Gellertiella hungarica]